MAKEAHKKASLDISWTMTLRKNVFLYILIQNISEISLLVKIFFTSKSSKFIFY